MRQQRNILLSSLLCLLAVIVVIGVLSMRGEDVLPVSESAVSCAQLTVRVHFLGKYRDIHAWRSSEGTLYYFLPAGIDNGEIAFSNIGAGSTLRLDTETYTSEHSVVEGIEYSRAYEMELSAEGGQPETLQVIFLKSEGVSSLFIDTESGGMENVHADKEVREAAFMQLIRSDGSIEYSGKLEYIKSRGNSSFSMEKKSYQVKLSKEYGLLDMPSAKKWILLADFIDDSLIKNEIIFGFAEKYTPVSSIQGRFVDLYLNGDYVGNYYLCEKIEVGKNRLDITDLEKKTEQANPSRNYGNAVLYVSENGNIKATEGLDNPSDISGGYLLEYIPIEEYNVADNAFMTDSGNCYEIVSPNPATVEQAEYICNQFNELEAALAQEDGVHPVTGKHFSEYLDVESWVYKYLMDEMFHNVDAVGHSMFFYKDADNINPRIFSGPMWDYDKALGSSGNAFFFINDANQVGDLGIYVREMLQHKEICQQVYDTFQNEFLPYAKYQIGSDVYQASRQIQVSAAMNRIRWPQVNGYYLDTQAGMDYMIDFVKRKAEQLEQVWLQEMAYCTVTFLDYNGNVYTKYFVRRGEYLSNEPKIANYKGIFNGWYTDEGVSLDLRLPVLQDVTYVSRWIDLDMLLQNGLDIAGLEISQADPEVLRQLADLIEKRKDETDDSKDME